MIQEKIDYINISFEDIEWKEKPQNPLYKLTEAEERFLSKGQGTFKEILAKDLSLSDKGLLLAEAFTQPHNTSIGPLAASYLVSESLSINPDSKGILHNLKHNLNSLKVHFWSGSLAQAELSDYYATSLEPGSLDVFWNSQEVTITEKADLLSKSFFYNLFSSKEAKLELLHNLLSSDSLSLNSKAFLSSSAMIAHLPVTDQEIKSILEKSDQIDPDLLVQFFFVLSTDWRHKSILLESDYLHLIERLDNAGEESLSNKAFEGKIELFSCNHEL